MCSTHFCRSLPSQCHLYCRPGLSYFVLVSFFIIAGLNEQCEAVKCCFLFDKNAAETDLLLKIAYKDDAMGKLKWFARFKTSDMSIDDEPRSESAEEIQKFGLTDHRLTINTLSALQLDSEKFNGKFANKKSCRQVYSLGSD